MKKVIIHIAFLFFCVHINGQQSFTNNGNLQIHTGASISGSGNFTNISSGVLVNNGSFYVKGNITNDQSSMAVGTGTLYMNGSAAQAVNGTQPFKTYNFVSNNSLGITLNNNLSVSGAHTFSAGLIATSATPNYLVYEAGSSYSGDNDSRHVNGWVKKYGSTNFTFPVGDATYERTAGITNLSTTSEFNCHYYKPTSNVFNLFSPIVQVHANEYWQINEISGGNARVTLNWDNSKVAMDNVLITNIRVAGYLAGYWRDGGGSASGNINTTGSVTSFSASSISLPFTLGYADQVLPLKILSFTAERRPGITYLQWSTENEQNVNHFEIERSANTINYTTIGTVAGRNISFQQHYDFEDHSSIQGIAYYRLKSVDYDGKFSYSKIIAVTERELQSSSFFILNPVRRAITIFNKTGYDGVFDYKLLNAVGQQVLNGKINMAVNGGAVLPLAATTAAGVYVLELNNANILFRQKLLIEK